MFSYDVATVLGSIAALVLTVLLYIKVMPRKLDGSFMHPALQKIHDFFHFKKLYLEEVLKFVYVLATVTTVCIGVFLLVSYSEEYHWGLYSSYTTKESTFLYGLLMIVGGPIVLRLTYEVLMMFILQVKNTIEINNKLSYKTEEASAPVEIAASAPAANVCPSCGAQLEPGSAFCTTCGHKL